MDSCGAHGRGRFVFAAALVTVAMLASPAAGHARVSGRRANQIMAHLLGRFAQLPNIVILRLPQPLPAGDHVSIADTGGGHVTLHHRAWLFWADLAPQKDLDHGSVLALIDASNEVLLSAVVVWEVALKRSLGKLEAPDDLVATYLGGGAHALPLSLEHAAAVGRLAWHHRDPFDRMLIAQAMIEEAAIVSRDEALRPYGVQIVW